MSDAESETSAPETDSPIPVPPKKRVKQEKRNNTKGEGDAGDDENKSPKRKRQRSGYGERSIEGMTTLEMIMEAIEYLADRKGVSARNIRQYILHNFKSVREGALKNLMKKALTKALAQEIVAYGPGHDEKLSLLNSKYVLVPRDTYNANTKTRSALGPQRKPQVQKQPKAPKAPKPPKAVTAPTRKSSRH